MLESIIPSELEQIKDCVEELEKSHNSIFLSDEESFVSSASKTKDKQNTKRNSSLRKSLPDENENCERVSKELILTYSNKRKSLIYFSYIN